MPMQRFVTFVDGSNLDGVLKHLNLRVDDYGSFYRHVFEQSVQNWGRTFADGSPWPSAQHSRIYWYVVGKMDEWDLNDPKAEARLRSRFELNPRLRDSYLEDIIRRLPDNESHTHLLQKLGRRHAHDGTTILRRHLPQPLEHGLQMPLANEHRQ